MTATSDLILPYEPQYVGHRDDARRHREVTEWLRQREQELDKHCAPPLVPHIVKDKA